jgi:hypothetical protein
MACNKHGNDSEKPGSVPSVRQDRTELNSPHVLDYASNTTPMPFRERFTMLQIGILAMVMTLLGLVFRLELWPDSISQWFWPWHYYVGVIPSTIACVSAFFGFQRASKGRWFWVVLILLSGCEIAHRVLVMSVTH